MASVRIYLLNVNSNLNDLRSENATTNYQGQLQLGWEYKDPNYNKFYPIFEKDLSFLGAITVSSVVFVRNAGTGSGSGTFPCTMYRVRRADWSETESTWTIYKTGNNWSAGGATDTTNDIDTTNAFTFTEEIATGNKTFSSDANIVALVQDAITSRSGIFRVMCKPDSPSGGQTKRIDWNPSASYFDITYTGGNTVSAAVTGTATSSITEADVVAGGKTIIETLTNETWLSGADFDAARAVTASMLDSAQSESTGWDQKVKPNIPVANVVRTSDTVVTITLQAQADYNITAQETITATIHAVATTHGAQIVASPTFTVDTGGAPPATPTITTPQRMRMGYGR